MPCGSVQYSAQGWVAPVINPLVLLFFHTATSQPTPFLSQRQVSRCYHSLTSLSRCTNAPLTLGDRLQRTPLRAHPAARMSTSTFFSRLPRFAVNAAKSMRSGRRASPILIAVAVLLTLLGLHLHLQRDWSSAVSQPIKTPPAVRVVVASLRSEDTSWVHRHLPNWSRHIYIVDDPTAEFTVPKNRGREAMVYLRYVEQTGLAEAHLGLRTR
jgi:hypothetical protein